MVSELHKKNLQHAAWNYLLRIEKADDFFPFLKKSVSKLIEAARLNANFRACNRKKNDQMFQRLFGHQIFFILRLLIL